jgi:uncharacterized protein (TIGR03083 family)
MEEAPAPWVSAIRNSQDRLRSLLEGLDEDQLQAASYDPEWSIAQVLSHLGSQAEIFAMFLDAGLSGQEPPGREAFEPIWEAWNARDPRAQATDSIELNDALVSRLGSLSPEEVERFHLNLFGMEIDAAGLARMRLSEHAVHTWDIAVAIDPAAEISPDAIELLVDTLDQLVARAGRPDGVVRRLSVETTQPERSFQLETLDKVLLSDATAEEAGAGLSLPAEAFVRLLYGRLDPDHTPEIDARDVDLDELRRIFPGF